VVVIGEDGTEEGEYIRVAAGISFKPHKTQTSAKLASQRSGVDSGDEQPPCRIIGEAYWDTCMFLAC
jgi:hypothetical protein